MRRREREAWRRLYLLAFKPRKKLQSAGSSVLIDLPGRRVFTVLRLRVSVQSREIDIMAETFTTENTTEAKKTSISETKQHLRTNGGAQTPKSVHAADCLPTYKPTKLAVVWLM